MIPPKSVRDSRLDIALRLYRAMCTQYPNRLIALLDESGGVVAQSDDVGATEKRSSNNDVLCRGARRLVKTRIYVDLRS